MTWILLAAALTLATPAAELEAQGFTLTEQHADGTLVWSRPLTHMQCGSGSCGTLRGGMSGCSSGGCSSQMMGCAGGSCGAPSRRGGGEMATGPVPRLVPIEKDEPAPKPTSEPTTKPVAQCEPVDVDKIAAAIVEKMASDPRFRGPKGEPGERGLTGPIGPAGPAGKDAQVNIDELAAAVLLRLPPVKLNLYDDVNGDGAMSEGETFRLSAPLGEPLKLEVTGGINAKSKGTQ